MRTLAVMGICAALVMCIVSAAMNYLFLSSLGKTPLEGHVLGVASAAADVLKALLPFFIAWSWKAGRVVPVVAGSAAFAFFAGFSFLSAIGFAADNRLVLLDLHDAVSGAYARVQRDVAALDRQLSSLPDHRPPAVVAEDINGHRQNRRWFATKTCREATEPQSREFCTAYFALRAELAAGREAARLSADIAARRAEAATLRENGAGTDRDPQVALLSRVFGQPQEPVRLALIIAVALLVEIGASLGLYLASGHGRAKQQPLPAPSPELGSVEDFCLEALVPAANGKMSDDDLVALYGDWCVTNGLTAMKPEEFLTAFAKLADVIPLPRRAGFYLGITASEQEHRAAA